MNQFDRMREKEAKVSPEDLRDAFDYDPATGAVFWRKCGNPAFNGKQAGRKTLDRWGKSYVMLIFKGLNFMVHRVAWAMTNGSWPKHQIDHRNGDGTDNRIDNLREATNTDNAKNQKLNKMNTSGHKGVRWHSIGKKWNARIVVDGVEKSLGLFHRIEDAVAARKAAEKQYGYTERE